MKPSNAAQAIEMMREARRPRPTPDEVLQRIGIHAAEGCGGVGYHQPLPLETAHELSQLGFEVNEERKFVWWHKEERQQAHADQSDQPLPKRISRRKVKP